MWSACCWSPLLTSVSAQCVLLNNDVDAIVRRARSKTVAALALRRGEAIVLLCDGFAVLDRERPYVDFKVAATTATGST